MCVEKEENTAASKLPASKDHITVYCCIDYVSYPYA